MIECESFTLWIFGYVLVSDLKHRDLYLYSVTIENRKLRALCLFDLKLDASCLFILHWKLDILCLYFTLEA